MSDTIMLGVIEHLDPNLIGVEDNIRKADKAPRWLVESVREFGVLTPVGCRRRPDGTVVLRIGQYRLLAAREAEQPTIPAYIVEGDDDTVSRILQQYAENEHRAGLTEPERAAVFQQLAFEGLSVPQIAKRTGAKKDIVEAGITVAASTFATKVATKHEVTLDQAATILEFEDDKEAVNALVRTAEDSPEQFRHELQRQRDRRERRMRIQAEQEALRTQGFTVLESEPYGDKAYTPIRDLVTVKSGKPVTLALLGGIPERFAYVGTNWDDKVKVTAYLAEFKAYGFKKAHTVDHALMTEAQKAERKALIANNKAWPSAEVVRREWLTGFLARKTLPRDAAQFVAVALTAHRVELAEGLKDRNRLAATLLGLAEPDTAWGPSPIDPIAATQPAQAVRVALGVVLGAFEHGTSRETWRHPSATDRAYFAQIAAWGYPLSDVEEIVVGAAAARGEDESNPQGEPDDQFEEIEPGVEPADEEFADAAEDEADAEDLDDVDPDPEDADIE